ncbi:Variable outer membrane protein, partial (plasmid) [Borrelia parkeri SLO]
IHDTVSSTKTSLEKIVADMKSDNNPNSEATDTAVKALITNTLDKIIQGAKTASEAIGSDSNPIANVADQNAGAAGEEASVKSLSEGIGKIVGVVLKEGNPEAGDDKKASDGSTARTAAAGDGEAGKLFATANVGTAENAKKSAADAAKAVGAVTGADILQAMVKESGDAAKLAKETTGNAGAIPKDATIAGAVVLRSMAKGGKFAGPSDAASVDAKKAVENAAVSAVTKALNELTIAIRDTIDVGLKSVKDAMKFNPNDTPVTTDNTISEVKKN